MSNAAPPSYGEAMEDKRFVGMVPQSEGPVTYPSGHPAAYHDTSADVPDTATVHPTHSHPADYGGETGGFNVRQTFSDKDVRRLFIRKVFLLLGLQLLVTFGIVTIFTLVEPVRYWVQTNPAMYFASYAVFLVLYFVLLCVEKARRQHPHNLIMLGLFTLALSYMTGTIAATYEVKVVMIALGVTVLVCSAIILFSIQTRFDFTTCNGLLFVLVMVLFWFGIITIFTYSYNWYVQVVYGSLAALVFSLFLAFDTQLIMGGRKYEMHPEEYVFGALNLYIDVVYIFLIILSLGGSRN